MIDLCVISKNKTDTGSVKIQSFVQNRQSEAERRQFLNARERERLKAKAAEFRRLTSANESLKIQVEV